MVAKHLVFWTFSIFQIVEKLIHKVRIVKRVNQIVHIYIIGYFLIEYCLDQVNITQASIPASYMVTQLRYENALDRLKG